MKSGKSLERALMGITIFHSMNHIGYPTLIIPGTVHFSPIHEIGIACDLDKTNDLLPFDTIKEWLYLLKGKVNILHISSEHKKFKSDKLSDSIGLINHLEDFHPDFHFLTGENIAEELNRFIQSRHIDLLIVVPKKHGIFQIFDKKISREIVAGRQVAVLSIHEKRK